MSINGFYLMPHPPIVIPNIGKGEEEKIKKTKDSLNLVALDIKEKSPEVVIVITPHGTMFGDAVALVYEDTIKGDLKKFGEHSISMELEIHNKLTSKIYELAIEEDIPSIMATDDFLRKFNSKVEIDHGVFVPLYFVNQALENYKIVHITYAPLSDLELYKFGICINKAVELIDVNAVLIASGDLSHRLKKDGPYDYNPYGEVFDKEFLLNLQEGNLMGIISMDKKTMEGAGECGRRSVLMLLGALDKNKFKGELLSYEGTFGVGYGVMNFIPTSIEDSKTEKIEELKKSLYEKKLKAKDLYVRLAWESLAYYLLLEENLSIFLIT